ncbi:hypothetical protein [Bacillus sp. JCM 19041]|uniref:hypothetical protein n=1 Tax=Bacillus sp. JCM 19041 TaxID=1460637 RepID=UPI0006D08EC0
MEVTEIFLKSGQSLTLNNVSFSKFLKEFIEQKGDAFTLYGEDGELLFVLLWSEIAGAAARSDKNDE